VPVSDIDVLRQGFEVFNRGDFEGLFAVTAEDVEVYIQEDLPNGGRWDGLDGFRAAVAAWMDAWDEFRAEPLGFEEGADGWLVSVKQHARTGDLALAEDFFYVFTLTPEGRISRWHLYNDEARARAAAGLNG
jgi:ketosteroid isomerase-like protein